MTTPHKPTWITLYAIGIIGIGALFCVPLLHMTSFVHTITLMLITAALFGTIGMWIFANSDALEAEGMDGIESKIAVHWDVASLPQDETLIATVEASQTHDHKGAA